MSGLAAITPSLGAGHRRAWGLPACAVFVACAPSTRLELARAPVPVEASAADGGDQGAASPASSASRVLTPIPMCIVNTSATTVELTIRYRGRVERLAIAPGNRDTPAVVSGFAANSPFQVQAFPLGANIPTAEREVPLLPRNGLTLLVTDRVLRVLHRGVGTGCDDKTGR